ncbi:sensor histidine kinase [Agromyces larvae]|uniref:histidine kinase n=1 Tax=Agromyces larvae TaxID=2929802 RepID=A0ABY4BZI6_9MICO|nr:sensor histidine kinase [Agromyces larvae]UOE44637.1 sensor histidine kinase [Agromyces larvae]
MPAPEWTEWTPRGPRGFRPPTAVVVWVPVVVALVAQVPAAVGIAVWRGEPLGAAALQIALAVAGPLALLASRRLPGPTVAVVTALAVADLLLTPDLGPPYVALGFAIILGVARGAVVWTAVSAGTGWIAAVVLGTMSGLSWHPFRIAAASAALAVCFAIGWFVRVRRARMAAFRAEQLQRRQTAEERERIRIARELHDVIGHALSQIHVQASVGLHLFDRDPEQARAALATVKETSKSALDEVRSVLGVIRDGDAPLAPQAELDQLPRLAAGMRSPGLAIELDDRLGPAPGQRPARAVQFAAYRIAQEALTNVVRHAGATRATVRVERDGGELVLTVEDDGRGIADATDAPGAGILGMRERAALIGGAVEVAARDGGGTRLVARLPWSAT